MSLSPPDLGFPESFESFRPAQEDAVMHALTTDKRFVGIGAPPGCGKSGIATALARLLGGRTLILTANRGLQDQYQRTLGSMGLVDMRGRSNFRCWEGGSCEDGGRLDCRQKEACPYIGRLRLLNDSDVGVSNYAWWLATDGRGVKIPDTLICDEAGLADGWLSRALDYQITEKECRESGEKLSPAPGDEHGEWIRLAQTLIPAAESKYIEIKARLSAARGGTRDRLARDLRYAEAYVDKTKRLLALDSNWTIERFDGTDEGRVWRFDCVWPGRYRERLFRYIPRVILMSATLRPKTLGLLGIRRDECDFREWPRQFPAANGPVVWVPTARVGHRMSDEDRERWITRIGSIFEWGADRNGLVHTVSFARAKEIANSNLALAHKVILNGAADPDSSTGREAYERFVKSKVPAVLVSPSFSTGWDFPGRVAEWQCISKIAFADTRSKVMQARCDSDRGYPNYLAAQDLVQGAGRIVRSDKDRGMTILLDDNWTWFRGAAEEYVPKWFKIRREESLPSPLEKI